MSLSLVQILISGLLLGAVYALFSSGLTLIWGMMNVVNFAHGDFVMIAMYTAFMVWKVLGGGPLLAMPLAAMLLATIGIIAYLGLVRHIMRGRHVRVAGFALAGLASGGGRCRGLSDLGAAFSADPHIAW